MLGGVSSSGNIGQGIQGPGNAQGISPGKSVTGGNKTDKIEHDEISKVSGIEKSKGFINNVKSYDKFNGEYDENWVHKMIKEAVAKNKIET